MNLIFAIPSMFGLQRSAFDVPHPQFAPNRTAAVSETNRSGFECAAAGVQHSRSPVHGEEVQGL